MRLADYCNGAAARYQEHLATSQRANKTSSLLSMAMTTGARDGELATSKTGRSTLYGQIDR